MQLMLPDSGCIGVVLDVLSFGKSAHRRLVKRHREFGNAKWDRHNCIHSRRAAAKI
jgi:hypothetical protein